MQNVEVYEVGQGQLWSWLPHSQQWSGGDEPSMYCIGYYADMDDFPKGRLFVVVEMAERGGRYSKPWLVGFYGSALTAATTIEMYEESCRDDPRGVNHSYEVWKIVDDADLWQEWEYRASLALQFDDADFDELADDAHPFGDCWESCIAACTPQNDDDVLDSLEQLRAAGELDGESFGEGYYHCDVTFDATELTEELIYSLAVVLMDLARAKGIELSCERWALRYVAFFQDEQIIFTEPTAALSVAASLSRWASAISHTHVVMFDNQNKDEKYSIKVVNACE